MFETIYSLKRILAYAVDMLLIWLISFGVSMVWTFFAPPQAEEIGFSIMNFAGSALLSYGVPIVLFGSISGIFGWSPGKLIFFLRIRKSRNTAPGLALGILREIVKYISISFFFLGGIWALVGIITRQKTFYDDWLNLDVEDIKPAGLTETQKNWRKTFRN
jgi:uncharacterized RDD family membrane protein YckC